MLDVPLEQNTEDQVCCRYCLNYRSTVKGWYRKRWLTISPPPNAAPPEEEWTLWVTLVFDTFPQFARAYIVVAEFDAQERLHFHCMYDLKDDTKEYIIINRLKQGGYTGSVDKNSIIRERVKKIFKKPHFPPTMARVYDGYPENGLHYLFKDIDTRTIKKIEEPITTQMHCGYPDDDPDRCRVYKHTHWSIELPKYTGMR